MCKKLSLLILVLGLATSFGCGSKQNVEDNAAQAVAETKMTVVGTAVSAGNFNTLIAALEAAGLTEALNGEGAFTVFAPTDEAFKALPEGTVAELLKPENKEKLASILKYHVIDGKVMAADVKTGGVTTLHGDLAAVVADETGVTYAGAKVTAADVDCTNGVIHVIDAVVMPPEKPAEAPAEPAADAAAPAADAPAEPAAPAEGQ